MADLEAGAEGATSCRPLAGGEKCFGAAVCKRGLCGGAGRLAPGAGRPRAAGGRAAAAAGGGRGAGARAHAGRWRVSGPAGRSHETAVVAAKGIALLWHLARTCATARAAGRARVAGLVRRGRGAAATAPRPGATPTPPAPQTAAGEAGLSLALAAGGSARVSRLEAAAAAPSAEAAGAAGAPKPKRIIPYVEPKYATPPPTEPVASWKTFSAGVETADKLARVPGTFLATSHEWDRIPDYANNLPAFKNVFREFGPSPIIRMGGASQDRMPDVPSKEIWCAAQLTSGRPHLVFFNPSAPLSATKP
jgi:hypothetical protein